MDQSLFNNLTNAEREDLALCGIVTQEQFEKATPQQLCNDLKQAKSFFPERQFCLTEEKLQSHRPTPQKNEKAEIFSIQSRVETVPPAAFRKRNRKHKSEKQKPQKKALHSVLHSPVRCTHRFTAIMAAICTLFLLIPVASDFVLPYMMITDQMPNISLELLASVVLIVPCAVYMFIARRATCPVCHMRIFRYSHYIRNKAAHKLPLLGYNFATALHLLFFLQYNCPGCGTPIKLLGAKGHRTHC